MHSDVIIIGAGPAGCAAAISCRLQGLNSLMITGKDKKAGSQNNELQPSESIHPGLITVLSQLNAAHCINIASQGVYEGIEVNSQYNFLGKDENGPWQGHHINRTLFDEALLQTAVEHGVDILYDDAVADIISTIDRVNGIKTKKGVHATCLYVIDASGSKGFAGKKLGFKQSFYSPPLVTWTGISNSISSESFLFKNNFTKFIPHTNGWTWLAPELPGNCTWTRLEIKGKQHYPLPTDLQLYPLAAKIKKSNRRWRVFRPICKEGVLLCGDAAGIIDPAAGQGILNALVSANMAAKTVKACISKPDFEAFFLAEYDNWFMNDYQNKVKLLKHFYAQHGIRIFEEGEA